MLKYLKIFQLPGETHMLTLPRLLRNSWSKILLNIQSILFLCWQAVELLLSLLLSLSLSFSYVPSPCTHNDNI